tara:strand:+ start:65 stop:586 length:522 start_codon:yes stop_codon:yes gene_type:complete
MDKKNNSKKRVFIPQTIGDTIKKMNKNFSNRHGKIDFVIHSNWSKIVGSYFKDYCEPTSITRTKDSENDMGEPTFKNCLNVSVSPAASIEFEHFKATILEKINSYFGFRAISDLRIQQNYITKHNIKNNTMKQKHTLSTDDINDLKSEVENLKNSDLKKSLVDLGLNIAKDSK